MRAVLTVYLLLSAILMTACKWHEQRNIREVSMTMEDTEPDGAHRSEVVTFRKDGGADRRVRITGRVGKTDFDEPRTGPMSPTTFAHLADAIEENDFYSYLKKDSKRDSFNGADLTLITVVDDQGSHDLVPNHGNPKQMSIINAIRQAESEITWTTSAANNRGTAATSTVNSRANQRHTPSGHTRRLDQRFLMVLD